MFLSRALNLDSTDASVAILSYDLFTAPALTYIFLLLQVWKINSLDYLTQSMTWIRRIGDCSVVVKTLSNVLFKLSSQCSRVQGKQIVKVGWYLYLFKLKCRLQNPQENSVMCQNGPLPRQNFLSQFFLTKTTTVEFVHNIKISSLTC